MKKLLYNFFKSLTAEKIIRYSIISLFFLYAFSIPSFGGREKLNYVMYGILILLAILSIVHFLLFKSTKINLKTWQLYLVPAFVVFAFIGTAIYSKKFIDYRTLVFLAGSFFVLLLSFKIINNSKLLISLIALAIFCFSIYFFIHYRDKVFQFELYGDEGFRLGGFFDNENAISAVFAIGFATSLFSFLFNKRWLRFLFLVPLFLIVLGGISTGSRAFLIAILMVTLVMLFFKFKNNKIEYLAVVILVVILLIIVINMPFAASLKARFERVINTFFGSSSRTDTSAIERVTWFEYGFYLGFKNILFGYGVAGFGDFSGVGTYAHSNLSEVICDFGIVGTVLFYFPLFALMFRAIKYKKKCASYVIPMFAYYLVISFANVFYYNKFYYLNLALMFFMVYDERQKEISIGDLSLNKIKIMFTCDGMSCGGAERVISILANSFANDGHTVSIVGVSTHEEKTYYQLDENVRYLTLHKGQQKRIGTIKRIFALRKIIRETKPDVIISFLPHVNIYTFVSMIGSSIPLIVSERNNPYTDPKGKLLRILKRYVFYKANGCVFQTEDAANYYSNKVVKKSSIISNPVTVKSDISIPAIRKKTIISVGRLEKQKNFKCLIDAFELFNAKEQDYVLKIYGEGSLHGELEDYIAGKSLQQKVRLVGNSNSWQEQEKDSSLFALSSDYEGMPNALAEAIAIGLPVVSTDCPIGGPKQLINVGKNGYLCNCNDCVDMSDKLMDALKIDIKEEDIKTFRKEFSSETVKKRWYDFMTSVIERKLNEQ